MKRRLKRVFLLFATGAASLLLSACYGPPMMLGLDLPGTIRIKVTNALDAAIPAIKVSASWLASPVYTDSQGYASLPTSGLGAGMAYCQVTLTDVDGSLNLGDFGSSIQTLDALESEATIKLAPTT